MTTLSDEELIALEARLRDASRYVKEEESTAIAAADALAALRTERGELRAHYKAVMAMSEKHRRHGVEMAQDHGAALIERDTALAALERVTSLHKAMMADADKRLDSAEIRAAAAERLVGAANAMVDAPFGPGAIGLANYHKERAIYDAAIRGGGG